MLRSRAQRPGRQAIRREMPMPHGRVFKGVLLTLATLALAFAASASAHFDSGLYTHNSCPGTTSNQVDPINIVYYDWGTWDRSASQTQSHTGWSDTGGSNQTFVDHGNCYNMVTQRASGSTSSTRNHIRFHGIHYDDFLHWTTVGDAHHEDFTWCGHAVDANGPSGSGFDQGRNTLRQYFVNAGHTWYPAWWGNSNNMRQCDGDYASSDGYTYYIHLHQFNH
jgi:hypothetical protein